MHVIKLLIINFIPFFLPSTAKLLQVFLVASRRKRKVNAGSSRSGMLFSGPMQQRLL